jgi:hypothetical protein
MRELLLIELNEVMFPYVEHYIRKGRLPHFAALFEQHGYGLTDSKESYANLEPWIQWVSAHTGLPYESHRVFRLGDIVGKPIPQIFELLEQRGISVGAVSPMNAENRLRNAAFFVPDPWTKGRVSGGRDLRRLYEAISNGVNENAAGRMSPFDAFHLAEGLIRYGAASNAGMYLHLAATSRGKPWRRALFLDLLLADTFLKLWRRDRPQFGLLFLNAAAHVQHHYLYSSDGYPGAHRNPSWYVPAGLDPLLEIYEVYDGILGTLSQLERQPRLLLATGLSQEPYPAPVYYYRLRDHQAFLRLLGVPFSNVQARMSRDFLAEFASAETARSAQSTLESVNDSQGSQVFLVDNRGSSLFVTLVFEKEIPAQTKVTFSGGEISDLSEHVAFVALKNGHHISTGYVLDTEARADAAKAVPVTDIFDKVLDHFSLAVH